MSMILHLDMDAFFASVEQAINPAFKGKPLIVGSRGKKFNTVVAACSYEAKAFGIGSGMSTMDAFRLCPQALFVAADSARYMHTSDSIAGMLTPYSDRMERASIDEFFLDCGNDANRAAAVAKEVKTLIRKTFSITGSVGIAPAKIIAKVAAKASKPDGLLVLKDEANVRSFLRNLPVQKIPGIGPRLTERLNDLSIFTCEELSSCEPEFLARRFGKVGIWMSEVSRGNDPSGVAYRNEEEPLPKSVGHSYTLEREISDREMIRSWLRMLAEMVAFRLRKDRLEAHSVRLYLSGRTCSCGREKKFSSATADAKVIYERSLLIMESLGRTIPARIRALGVGVSYIAAGQGLFLLEEDTKRARLLGALDTINGRFGDWSVFPASVHRVASKKKG